MKGFIESFCAKLKNLKSVDEVIFFSSEDEFEELIKSLHPDIIIVGSDWKEKSTIKSYYDGELIFFDRMQEYSTTKTIGRIRELTNEST